MEVKAVKTDVLGAVTIGDIEFSTEEVLQEAGISKDELRKMIAAEITEQVFSELKKGQKSAFASFVNRVADTNKILYGINTLMKNVDDKVRLATSGAMQKAVREANEAAERLELVKRQPNGEANSVSPVRWQCNVCGTICGKMNIFGKMRDKDWTTFPKYCPGCGAKNVNYVDESDLWE